MPQIKCSRSQNRMHFSLTNEKTTLIKGQNCIPLTQKYTPTQSKWFSNGFRIETHTALTHRLLQANLHINTDRMIKRNPTKENKNEKWWAVQTGETDEEETHIHTTRKHSLTHTHTFVSFASSFTQARTHTAHINIYKLLDDWHRLQ